MPAVTVRFRNLCVKGRVVAAAPAPPASGTSKVQTATQVSRLEQGSGCPCLTSQMSQCSCLTHTSSLWTAVVTPPCAACSGFPPLPFRSACCARWAGAAPPGSWLSWRASAACCGRGASQCCWGRPQRASRACCALWRGGCGRSVACRWVAEHQGRAGHSLRLYKEGGSGHSWNGILQLPASALA